MHEHGKGKRPAHAVGELRRLCGEDGAQTLAEVVRRLPATHDPNLLVGMQTSDDAGVYRISENLALVNTVDFFPPIVDDPYDFGRIAAANALSDVYAMGARPLTAMNLVAFPKSGLSLEVLHEILRGGADKLVEAGVALVGGHSVTDPEPKYGLAVTGLVDPARVVTNAGARAGDALVLTKPVGVGIITTALKQGMADAQTVAQAVESMAQLNRRAAELMVEEGAHACTDITGYGLLGHALEMAAASGVMLHIAHRRVPHFPRRWRWARSALRRAGCFQPPRLQREDPVWRCRVGHVARPAVRPPDLGRAAHRAARGSCHAPRRAACRGRLR